MNTTEALEHSMNAASSALARGEKGIALVHLDDVGKVLAEAPADTPDLAAWWDLWIARIEEL